MPKYNKALPIINRKIIEIEKIFFVIKTNENVFLSANH